MTERAILVVGNISRLKETDPGTQILLNLAQKPLHLEPLNLTG